MRTVTFADLSLVDKINSTVIPVWNNLNPQLERRYIGKQTQPTKQQIAAYPQGGGVLNVRTYFCTQSREILHYTQGYWDAEKFSEELEFALKQYEFVKMQKEESFPKKEIVDSLKKRTDTLQQQNAMLRKEHADEFKKKIATSSIRKQHAAIRLKITADTASAKIVGESVKSTLTQLTLDVSDLHTLNELNEFQQRANAKRKREKRETGTGPVSTNNQQKRE